jgi:hypothetical protein
LVDGCLGFISCKGKDVSLTKLLLSTEGETRVGICNNVSVESDGSPR